MNGTRIFVAGHTDEMIAAVPRAADYEAVDLRALTVESPFERNLLAESRFLVSEEARRVRADHVGYCSANYDQKYPAPPHLAALARLTAHLQRGEAMAPALASRWPDADRRHPGMAAVLERVAARFDMTVLNLPVPWSNTFVCPRDEWFRLLDSVRSMLDAVVDWYGLEPPYGYRCNRCGHVSAIGHGRYTRERHLAFLGERLTMLHFASRPGLHFVTPRAVQLRSSRVRRAQSVLRPKRNADRRDGVRVVAPAFVALAGVGCPECRRSPTDVSPG